MAVGPRRPGRSDAARVSAAGAADGVADLGEGVVGVAAQGRDGRDADDDDQGQHHRVLDRRRAVFRLQEADHRLSELTHRSDPFRVEYGAGRWNVHKDTLLRFWGGRLW